MSYMACSTQDSPTHKSHFDPFAHPPPHPASLPNSPLNSIGQHLPPRSYTAYPMAHPYGPPDPHDPLVAAAQASDASLASPLLSDALASSSSAHPSRVPSPAHTANGNGHGHGHGNGNGNGNGGYYTTFEPALPASQPHSRQQSADGVAHRPLTPEPYGARTLAQGQTLKVIQWTPQRGDEGTQVTIVLDAAAIRAAQPSPFSPASPSFGPGSPALGSSPRKPPAPALINRRFVVVFGQAQAPTKFTRAQAIDGNGVGQSMTAGPNEEDAFVVLTTFVPSRHSMGPPGERAMVLVQVVDDQGGVVESCIVGEWDPQSLQSHPATPSRVNALKRSGDELVSDRDAPGTRSPSQLGSPVRQHAEWQSPSLTQQSIPSIQTTDEGDGASLPHPPPVPQLLAGQPELIRTSQIHAPKNGYGATYSHKVVLKLQGDLNTMAMGWTNEEWTNRRRLIQFWPQQDGNVINVAFRPIAQSEYVQNSIVVSCIFRDEWNECFVTSVDTIYLLEALVGARFTVEEKNRIRRNLEGFKPMTVSKSKPDSEPFFKLIMGFPNPKPRNIEKDVKVFPWKILGNALKKIMSKYSANYPLAPDAQLPPVPASASDSGSTSQTPLSVAADRFAPPVSPHLNSPHVASPHLAHGSPHLTHGSPHLTHASPHLGSPHLPHSPHFVSHTAAHDVVRSPQLDAHHRSPAIPHSPQQSSMLSNAYTVAGAAPASARGPYDINGVFDGGGADYSQAHYPGGGGGGGGGTPTLFPSAEDYGVVHVNGGGPTDRMLAPAPPPAALNHIRSFSEGMQRPGAGAGVGAGAAYHSPQQQATYGYDANGAAANYYAQQPVGPQWGEPENGAATLGGPDGRDVGGRGEIGDDEA